MGSCWEAAFSLCLCFASITADSTILMSPSILTTSSSYVFLQTSQRWRYILVTSLFPSHSGTEGQFKGLLTKVCAFELLTMDRSPRWKPTWTPTNHATWAKTRPQNLCQQLHFKAQDETNQMRYEAVLLKNRVGRLFLEVNGVNLTVRICAWPPLTLFFCCDPLCDWRITDTGQLLCTHIYSAILFFYPKLLGHNVTSTSRVCPFVFIKKKYLASCCTVERHFLNQKQQK